MTQVLEGMVNKNYTRNDNVPTSVNNYIPV